MLVALEVTRKTGGGAEGTLNPGTIDSGDDNLRVL
jgi:hypothetical protein